MQGWVIVYVPGGDIYQLLDLGGSPVQKTLTQKIVKNSIKTFGMKMIE